jgi:hypothetical protein
LCARACVCASGDFEKFTRVTMILPLTGEQYAEKVTENCVAFWKAAGLYTDAEGVAVEKFREVFKPETFAPGASILFTHSPAGVLTVSTNLLSPIFLSFHFRLLSSCCCSDPIRSVPFHPGRLLQGLVGAGGRRRGDREQAPLRGRAGVHHRGARRVAGREAEPRREGVGAPRQGDRRGRRRAAGGARLHHRLRRGAGGRASERTARRKKATRRLGGTASHTCRLRLRAPESGLERRRAGAVHPSRLVCPRYGVVFLPFWSRSCLVFAIGRSG